MENKKKDTNFELLRIVAMILIVFSHYVWHTNVCDAVEIGSFNYYLIEFIRLTTRISVNLYVMISGYYLINSKMKIRRLFDICVMVIFYSIIFLPIPYIIEGNLAKEYLITTLFPINRGAYWFATIYIVLYSITPFLNMFLKNLTKDQYKLLLIILGIPLIISKTIFNKNNNIDSMNGESLIFFVYLYMLAGYIRLYYDKEISKNKWIGIAILAIVIDYIIRIILLRVSKNNATRTINFSNIFIVIASISIFMCFKKIRIKSKLCNKAILAISPLTFGIYLIHENILLRIFIWKIVIHANNYARTPYLIYHIIICVIAVFGSCAIIELIRQKLFALLNKTHIVKKINTKLDRANEKFWNLIDNRKGNNEAPKEKRERISQ